MKAIVQLRGEVNQSASVRDTLEMLNLGRVNHATMVPETPAYAGMVTKVNDWVAHGEPSERVVATLLRRRGEPTTHSAAEAPTGETEITDDWVATETEFADIEALASALVAEETTLKDVGLSPTLRLHPPRGGHDGLKQSAVEGGQIGHHEPGEIDALLEAMR